MHEQLRMTPKEFTRYKYHEIDWASRLVGIVGPRGVGKSTMVLQWITPIRDKIAISCM